MPPWRCALATARHDFAAAAGAAAQALAVNPYSATAWGVLTDARTQLGDYAGATDAVQRMLQLAEQLEAAGHEELAVGLN